MKVRGPRALTPADPPAATADLAALLAPLDAHPELLLTLETHLRHGRSRRATADALHLHPNTVDYRLRRVAALTGLDPADDGDVQRVGAALAARRAQG
ncbi:helix-turn-helix domain-containing protein [Nonomuraea sp. NPDC003804]|uniref:helix-turn-helix domain-containing protein n=1 Tax=Nonomuraea sp. NPDC003804 TaxID=3154547 RepID=UPI0033A98EA0